jgi:hypothetical protein
MVDFGPLMSGDVKLRGGVTLDPLLQLLIKRVKGVTVGHVSIPYPLLHMPSEQNEVYV